MVAPTARPIQGFVKVPVAAEANPVVNAHVPGSCSTGRGGDGSSAPMAALARARMRSTAVTLFMFDGSPVGIGVVACACCSVYLSKFWVQADGLRLVEAVAFAGTVLQETQAAQR